MKKSSIARIMILVLSLALLIGSVMVVTAMADEEVAVGSFNSISVAYGDKVYIRVEVKATEDQIKNNEVVVSYKFSDETETKNATYRSEGDTAGYVWVVTEGIAAYDMAREVVFSSNVGETQVETDRTYSVAQFLYKKLYTDAEVDSNYKAMYEALINYGATAQTALKQNTDKMINNSTLVTGAEGITFDGKDFVFVPGAKAIVEPTYANLGANDTIVGWEIVDNGTTKTVEGTSFECSGVVEVLAPVCNHIDTVKYEWAADNSYCKAYIDCTEHAAEEIVYIDEVKLNVTATKVTYTYNVAFTKNALFEAQTKTVEADVTLENSIATINAPKIANKVASHDYMKFDFHNTEATYEETIYYSAVSVWDGTSVSESLKGSGTEEDPFLIQSAADFVCFANTLNNATVGTTENYSGQYVKMTVSVDLNNNLLIAGNHSGWNQYQGFGGTFDGNNCTIRNINAQPTTGTSSGLFGCITKAGTLKNLSVYGNASGAGTVGGVVAYQLGKVTNVTSYVTVTATGGTIGGVVANQEGSAGALTDCVNYGSVTTTSYIVGGITGSGGATITDCTNWGSVQGGDETIGGIAGTTKNKGTISGCYNYGSVKTTATDKGMIGGIVGKGLKPISDCYNFGEITGVNTTGGIVGTTDSAITNCYNYGAVNATSWNIGGIVGSTTATAANVSGCKNYGAITSTGDCVGGIVGSAKSTISNCENFGTIKGKGRSAGIAYWSNGTIENCTNNGEIIGGWDLGGILAYLGEGVSATITNCTNNGNITGTYNNGGIFGLAHENAGTVTITGCTNNGDIVSTSGGQITIAAKAVITDCNENGSWTKAE